LGAERQQQIIHSWFRWTFARFSLSVNTKRLSPPTCPHALLKRPHNNKLHFSCLFSGLAADDEHPHFEREFQYKQVKVKDIPSEVRSNKFGPRSVSTAMVNHMFCYIFVRTCCHYSETVSDSSTINASMAETASFTVTRALVGRLWSCLRT
jgi:hypothetical protein